MSDPTDQPDPQAGSDGDGSVVEVLEAYWRTAPEPDVDALWSRIAPGLGPQPPPSRPWYRRGFPFAVALVTHRTVAIGATAAVVAVALLVGAFALRPQPDASAAVLEAVQDLSASTDDALQDDELSPDETAQLQRRATALLEKVGGDADALGGLSADELADVVARLEGVLTRLSSYRDAGDGGSAELEEAEHSVREVATAVTDERHRRGYSDDDGEDRSGSSSSDDGGEDRSGSSSSDDDGHDGEDEHSSPTAAPSASPTTVGAATAPGTTTPVASPSPTADHEDTHESGDEHEGDDGYEVATPTAMPVSPTPSPTAAAAPSPTATATQSLPPNSSDQIAATEGEFSYAVGEAGTVRFAFDGHEALEVLAATPNAGWTVAIEEEDGSEIRVAFYRDGVRGRFEAGREDDRIDISIRWEQ